MLRELLDQLTLDELIGVLYSIVARLAWRGLFSAGDIRRVRSLAAAEEKRAA